MVKKWFGLWLQILGIMKKYCILLLFISYKCLAQMPPLKQHFNPFQFDKKNALKINLTSPVFFTLSFSYEHKLGVKTSFQQGISITQFSTNPGRNRITYISGFQLTSDFRIYFNNEPKLNGYYQQPFIRYSDFTHQYYINSRLTNTVKKIEEQVHGLTFGYALGKQVTYNNKWLFDYFLGICYSFNIYYQNNQNYALEYNPWTNGIGFRPGLKAGYLF